MPIYIQQSGLECADWQAREINLQPVKSTRYQIGFRQKQGARANPKQPHTESYPQEDK